MFLLSKRLGKKFGLLIDWPQAPLFCLAYRFLARGSELFDWIGGKLPQQSVEIGEKHEEFVAGRYRREGYRVLRVSNRSFPDLIVMRGKQVVCLAEVKTGNNYPTTKQINLIKKLKKREGLETIVYWVDKKGRKIIDCKQSSEL